MSQRLAKYLGRRGRALRKRLGKAWRRVFPGPPPIVRFLRHVEGLARAHSKPGTLRDVTVAFVVPVYNTKPAYLDTLLASVRAQAAGAWELILCDDGSRAAETRAWLDRHAKDADLRILRLERNQGIAAATNAAIAAARAPWTALVDHDDALMPFALERILGALADAPDCQFLYTDEVIGDARLRPTDVFLKPAFDPVLLSGVNYINHLSLYRRERLLALGGLRQGFEGSQDHDLLLRYTAGLRRPQCLHLPYPAYLWRRDGSSYSAVFLDRATASARRHR
jgi:O-antigen biosynthesis protein